MAEAAPTVERASLPTEEGKLLPAPEVSMRRAARLGFVGGASAVFVSAVGMVTAFQDREVVVGLSLAYLMLLATSVIFGYFAGRPPERREGFQEPRTGARNVLAGAIVGILSGAVFGAFILFINGFEIRDVFRHISPELVELLTLSRGAGISAVVYSAAAVVLGAAGAAAHLLCARWRRPLFMALIWVVLLGLLEALVRQLFAGARLSRVASFLFEAHALTVPAAAIVFVAFFALYWTSGSSQASLRQRFDALPENRRHKATIVGIAVLLLVLAALPWVLGTFLSEVADIAGIFLLMALGLNIVVGFAGLLDLGYVAFFAVGAYTMAVLTSPSAHAFAPELNFWVALPFVGLAAALSGVLVGVPVLRMRGDYLAIVTLGFGEIARLLFLSDWLSGTFGGAQGIINIPNIQMGPIEVQGSQAFFYAIFGFALVAAYITYSLEDSRIGRAWMAIREDESVAEAMGVNVVSAKIYAFVVGAILAGFAGALFAVKIGSIFPHSFSIIVSINVLMIIIIGGLGSVIGVVVGALVLVGVPELLREFDEFRFLIYGALLILMMLKRPEGLLPSRRRAAELHEEDVAQDAWLKEEQEKQERAESVPAEP